MIVCPYCHQPAKLTTGADLFPERHDLASLFYWKCNPCGAWVGCHPGGSGKSPLGSLANAELRIWRVRAHAAFDPWYTSGVMTRNEAYKRLAKSLGIKQHKCHIGKFDIDRCRRVIEIVQKDWFIT